MRNAVLKPTGSLLLITFLALVLGFSFTMLALRLGAPEVSADQQTNMFSVNGDTLGDLVINLTPFIAVNQVGSPHTVTATITTTGNHLVQGKEVSFKVISGPTAGVTGSQVTGADGKARFTYTGHTAGIDTIAACFSEASGAACDLAIKQWTDREATGAVDLTPPRAINPVGSEHTLTATVTDADGEAVSGVRVRFRVVNGPHEGMERSVDTGNNGRATFTYTGTAVGRDTIRACVNNPVVGEREVCDDASKRWTPVEPARSIVLEPKRAANPVDTRHTVTATVTGTGSTPLADIEVRFRVVEGPHEGVVRSVDTNDRGKATFTYHGNTVGTDTIRACVNDLPSGELCDEAAKRWTPNEPARAINLTPARGVNQVGAEHTLTARVTATDAEPVSGVTVRFRVMDGPHEGVTGSANTNNDGVATFKYTGNSVGTDTIRACVNDLPDGEVCDEAAKRWTPREEPPVDKDSCQGENSCRGRNISVGENSCNAESSCNGNNITVGDNSCNEEGSCNGNGSHIGDRSCNGEESCRKNNHTIGDNSCNGEEACNGNHSNVGNGSCNGEEACSGNNNSVGNNSCNSEGACTGNNNSVGDNTCNTEEACPGRGNKGGDRNGRGGGDDEDEDEDDEEDDDDNRKGKGRGRNGDD